MESTISPLRADAAPPLYSARVVRAFSMLFSAVAGGLLMAQNLRDVDQPDAARMALWGSIGYTVVLLGLSTLLPDKLSGVWLPLVVGYAGAMGLEAYFAKFVPSREGFPAKSIKKPLIICLAIFIPLTALVIYAVLNTTAA